MDWLLCSVRLGGRVSAPRGSLVFGRGLITPSLPLSYFLKHRDVKMPRCRGATAAR